MFLTNFLTFEQVLEKCNLIRGHGNDYWIIDPPLKLEVIDPPLEDWLPNNIVHADVFEIITEKEVKYSRVSVLEAGLWYNTFLFKLV